MTSAKAAEIKSLLETGTLKLILKKKVPFDGNTLPVCFFLAIKSTDNGKLKFKARCVIGVYLNKFKDLMVHSALRVQPQAVKLLTALTLIFGFHFWTSNFRQAYLQSTEPQGRDIFTRKLIP